ncbi:IclR family transcriptional regulator [bacterium LRH843]|nr:IclR family transcriptional regulator [bacterium LRH843]
MNNTKRPSYGNVSHALDVLLLFKKETECTLGEMAELLHLRKSYLVKLLTDLKEKSFISQDPETGKYRLGLTCLELGSAFEKRLDIRTVARPYLEELASSTQELVHLGVMDSNVIVLLDRKMNQESGLHLQFHLSLTSPPYSTALGKILLASRNEKEIESYLANTELKPFSPHTTIDPDMFRLELKQIQRDGFYLSYETFESGISCLAAPVAGKNGDIIAAISICAPTVRIVENKNHYKDHLLETTLKVSEEFGYKRIST